MGAENRRTITYSSPKALAFNYNEFWAENTIPLLGVRKNPGRAILGAEKAPAGMGATTPYF